MLYLAYTHMYIVIVTAVYGLDKQTYNIQYKNIISHAVKYYTNFFTLS